MDMSGLSPGTLGVPFKTKYYPPGHHFINFYNVDRQKPLWIILTGPQ